jgi:iron complex outermembrane recepter protein
MRSNRALRSAVALVLASASSYSLAQQAPAASEEVGTVIITGTYIRGTAEDAALPVEVLTAEDLQKQGSPSTLEMLKQLNVSNGVLGDSNQFDARAQGSEGSGSVNLRGLGPARTLVLMNGRRMVPSPFTGAIDTNLLPTAAVGRIEVLKDGAAATYGSDAIAGVVNFITKTGQQGFDISADYKHIDASDGDYTLGVTYGGGGDSFDFLVSGGYQHRSELMARDREWATRDYLENPQGGWSAAGNPATFVPTGVTTPSALNPLGAGVTFRDPQCGALGAFPGFTGSVTAPTPVCYWQYTQFDALTEKEERYQAYAEFNVEFGNDMKFHIEGLYAGTETPIYRTSPSYAALQTPCGTTATATCTAGTSPVPNQYFVPANNPGLVAFNQANPGLLTGAGGALGTGALAVAYRPFAIGGNPFFGYDSSEGPRRYHAHRGSASLSGSFGEFLNWDVGVTYMEQTNKREGRDTVVNRLQMSLMGLGGPNCNGITAGTAGSSGCFWLNPFSNAIPRNAITGATNSQFGQFGYPNENRELLDWMFPKLSTEQVADILVADLVLNGKTGLSLGGGDLAWAAGVQYRDQSLENTYSDLNNFAVVPCVNSVRTGIVGPSACTPDQIAAPGGPLLFLGGAFNSEYSQDVSAVFAEISLPFLDSLQAQVAARYEDYGGNIGNTFDPKLSLRWQIVDSFALRGSVGTTFRGPPLNLVTTNTVTTLQSISGTFRAIRTAGNPNLKPESAFTFNVGMLVQGGGFTGSVDYWSFDFEDQIVTEPVAGIVNAVFPVSGASCASPLVSRFTFNGACSAANITRLDIGWINGPKLKTSGVDIGAKYDFSLLEGLSAGLNATYVLKYELDALSIGGVQVQAAFDAAGKLNYQTTAFPLPKKKGSMFFEYSKDIHNIRWVVNYVDKYEDQRTDIFTPSAATNAGPSGTGATGNTTAAGYAQGSNIAILGGKEIAATVLHSLYYQLALPVDVTLTLAVENIFDRDPSFARLDLSYDPFTGSPFGRTYKFGVRYKF